MRVLWEAWLSNDKLVKLITEEIGTARSSMAIIDSEEGALWPFLILRAIGRFHYVEDYGDPVFIVSPDNALMCIHSIPSNAAMSSDGTFCARSVYTAILNTLVSCRHCTLIGIVLQAQGDYDLVT